MSEDSRAIAPGVLMRARDAVGHVVGGRYSRGAWVAASLAYLAALALVIVPPSTYLWTSPRPFRDLYWTFVIGTSLLAAAALILTYAKRLHDQNLIGFWAVIPLLVLPWCLIWTATTWANHIWKQDHTVSTSAYTNIAAAFAFALIVLVGLRRPQENTRFGARIVATDILNIRHPAALLLATVAGIVVLVSLYASFFQSGIWVGRQEQGYDTGTLSTSTGGGSVLATCGGAKGVSAITQQGQASGFVKDAVPGSWNLVRLPDGSLDIQTLGKDGSLSYRQDGFSVQTQGLRLNDVGQVAADIDGFQVIAQAENIANHVRTVTTISLARRDFGYQATIASSRVLGRGALIAGLSGGHPRASSFLMIADCYVYQDDQAAAKR